MMTATTPAQQRASDHLVRGVDFLFALTLGQSILLFQDFWTAPFAHDHLTVALALLAIYVVTLHSFVDWHLAMEDYPYGAGWDESGVARTFERLRFVVDVLIVGGYAFLVVNAVPLVRDPGHDLSLFLGGFPFIFGLYTLWALLRRRRYPKASRPWASFAAVAGTAVMLALHEIDHGGFLNDGADQNNIYLVLMIAVTLVYRIGSSAALGRWRGI